MPGIGTRIARVAAALLGAALLGAPAPGQPSGAGTEAPPSAASEAEASPGGAGLPAGREVARRINARDEGRKVARRVVMRLVSERGHERERVTRSFRRYFGEEKRTAVFYLEPTTVRGTAFLTHDHPEPGREDDQWLYLPALRKVRRISAANRGDSFLGTDLTYEEIKKETQVAIEDYRWTSLRREPVEGHACVVVEQIPVDDATADELGYSKVISWVDSEIWMVRRSEHFDLAGEHLKSVRVSEIRKVDGIWTPHRIDVRNHQTGHRTLFRFEAVDYEAEVGEELFRPRTLRRGIP